MKQIYVHGLGQTSDSWNGVVTQLCDAEFKISLDLIKLLESKKVTYYNLYTSFSGVCDSIGEAINLCGLSLGGVLALNYAIDHPEKVKRLVLIATQYKMPKKLLMFQNMLFRFMPKSMFQQMGFRKSDFLELCRTMMPLDFSNSVQKVSCPVLVVCGEKDGANKHASIELADNLNCAELQILNGVGHEVNVEAPEKLAQILHDFYNRV